MGDLWPNWVGFSVSLLLAGATILTAYNGDTLNKKIKFICAFWVYVVSAAIYGAMALGQTEFDRADGVSNLFWGHQAMWAIRYGAITAFITACITYALWNTAVSFIFGTLSGVGLLCAQLSLDQNQRIFWFCFAGAFWILNGIYWLLIAFRADRWLMFPQKSRSPSGEGTNVALSRFWILVVVIAAIIGTASYHLFWALERGGFAVIDSHFFIMLMYIFVCDGMVLVILMVFCLWYINPDGSVSDRNALLKVGRPAARLINPKGIPGRAPISSGIGSEQAAGDSDDEGNVASDDDLEV